MTCLIRLREFVRRPKARELLLEVLDLPGFSATFFSSVSMTILPSRANMRMLST